jgi:hypothetical protein
VAYIEYKIKKVLYLRTIAAETQSVNTMAGRMI